MEILMVGCLSARPYNKNDQLLQEFVNEHELFYFQMNSHTFYHHSGSSSSQIDYIMSTDKNLLRNYTIAGKDCSNTSSHVEVSAKMQVHLNAKISNEKKSCRTVKNLCWDRVDRGKYEMVLRQEIEKIDTKDITSTDLRLQEITNAIHIARTVAVPKIVRKLKGPSWKASPTVLKLLNECKKKYRLWVASGRTDNILRIDKVMAKRELRKQLRKEKFTDRRNFYAELMSNPTDKFYQLIRKNNGNRRQNAECILADGEEVTSPEKQRLAKDQGYDSAYLELCSARHNIIT